MKRAIRRLLLAGAAGLAVLAAAYLGGVNAYLRSGRLQRALDKHPDHFFVRYAAAWTLWPGIVHLRGLELHGQARTSQWWVGIDRATLALDLPRLLHRELVATTLSASGVAFRLRRRPESVPGAPPPDQMPPISGLVNTPAPPAAPEPRADADSWRIRLADVTLEQVREIWIGALRYAGDARVVGGFDLYLDHRFALDPATADLRSASLQLAARPVLESLAGTVQCELPPFDPNHLEGGFLRLASGEVRLKGRIRGLSFIEPYLRQVHWIELTASPGTLDANLRVLHGTYQPGSHVEARLGRIVARLLDDEAWGRGEVRWDVMQQSGGGGSQGGGGGIARMGGSGDSAGGSRTAGSVGSAGTGALGGGGAMCKLVAVFDEFQLTRPGVDRPRAHGRGLRLEIDSHDLAINALPAPSFLAVDLPPAEVGDFSSYNAFLPAGAGVALRSGTGLVSASLRAAAPGWDATGKVDLRGRDIVADVQGSRLRGDLRARSRFRAQPRQRRLFLAESDVELAQVVRLDAGAGPPGPGWWARAHLDNGAMRAGSKIVLQAKVHTILSDTRPLLALFAPRPGRLLSWLDHFLDLRPIAAVGDLAVGEGYLAVDDLVISSGTAHLRARLRFAGGRRYGILYAAYGPLSVGLELQGQQRTWKLIHPRQWFDSHTVPAPPRSGARSAAGWSARTAGPERR